MCEFHDSNCNGFGDNWWTDKIIYFSSIDVNASSGRIHRMKGSESPVYDSVSGNPFADLPSLSYTTEMLKTATDAALIDFDKFANAPDCIEEDVWHHLCNYRRQKIDSEHLVC